MTTSIATAAAADFLKFDGLEAITYVARRTDERGDIQQTKISIANALRRAINHKDRQLGSVGIDDAGTVWHIRRQDIVHPVSGDIIIPQRGDSIISAQLVGDDPDGDLWGVRSFDLQTLGTRWRMVCVMGEL